MLWDKSRRSRGARSRRTELGREQRAKKGAAAVRAAQGAKSDLCSCSRATMRNAYLCCRESLLTCCTDRVRYCPRWVQNFRERCWHTGVLLAPAGTSVSHTHKHGERVGDAFARRLLCQFANEPDAARILLWRVCDQPGLWRVLRVSLALNAAHVALFLCFLKPQGAARADCGRCACRAAGLARQGLSPPRYRLHCSTVLRQTSQVP